MTTSPPQVNGHRRPLPVITDWRTFAAPPAEQPVVEAAPQPASEPAEPAVDLVAQAEADAIRTRAYAEAEEQRIAAEAEAKAIEIKAEAEAEKLRLANERAAMRMERDRAEHDAHLEDIQRKREQAARQAEDERVAAEQASRTEAQGAAKVDQSANRWRNAALAFAVMCAIVALPVQMSAFYNPAARWLLAAPVMLEAGAWVILAGAAAAVAAHRPHWHYRLIAWSLAFVAAGVNLWHGLEHFDPATAIGTAFASLAGPGVWDLHEHGRIRKRDGVLSRRERRAKKRDEDRADAAKRLEEKTRRVEKEAADKAVAEAAEKLDRARAENFPKVWAHALKIAAALGETTVTEAVWRRAHRDIEGADPAESADVIRGRNAAEMRVEAARLKKPVNTLSKTTNAQRASQMPPTSKQRIYNPPARAGRRRPGDTPKYVSAARKQAAITAKTASTEEQK